MKWPPPCRTSSTMQSNPTPLSTDPHGQGKAIDSPRRNAAAVRFALPPERRDIRPARRGRGGRSKSDGEPKSHDPDRRRRAGRARGAARSTSSRTATRRSAPRAPARRRRWPPRTRSTSRSSTSTCPARTGLSLARHLRERYAKIAIVMLTSAGTVVDRIVGLEMGADDYVPKPFDPRELVARVKSVLRRTSAAGRADLGAARVRIGRCVLDVAAHRLTDENGADVAMSPLEFDLLKALAEHPEPAAVARADPQSHQQRDWDPFDRSVDLRIMRLRKKIEPDPSIRGSSGPCATRATSSCRTEREHRMTGAPRTAVPAILASPRGAGPARRLHARARHRAAHRHQRLDRQRAALSRARARTPRSRDGAARRIPVGERGPARLSQPGDRRHGDQPRRAVRARRRRACNRGSSWSSTCRTAPTSSWAAAACSRCTTSKASRSPWKAARSARSC